MAVKKADTAKKQVRKTKEEVEEVYTDTLQGLQLQAETQLNSEKIVEARKTKAAIDTAEALATENISGGIQTLKSDIGQLLDKLAERLDQQIRRFADLQKAISAKEQELNEIYGIEKAAGSLAALIEAHNRKQLEFEREEELVKSALDEEMTLKRAAWDKEKQEWTARQKESEQVESQKRERARAEFEYTFKREQQLALDKAADDKRKMEKELQDKREALEKELAEKARPLREAEAELKVLREKDIQHNAQLQGAVEKAIKETSTRLQSEATAQLNLMKKEFEGERNVLNARIEALQAQTGKQAEQIARLSQQHELAYEKVQSIALKALEGATGSKAVAALQESLLEQSKRQAREEK